MKKIQDLREYKFVKFKSIMFDPDSIYLIFYQETEVNNRNRKELENARNGYKKNRNHKVNNYINSII